MPDVPDPVGKRARDAHVTGPDGHHGQHYLRSVKISSAASPRANWQRASTSTLSSESLTSTSNRSRSTLPIVTSTAITNPEDRNAAPHREGHRPACSRGFASPPMVTRGDRMPPASYRTPRRLRSIVSPPDPRRNEAANTFGCPRHPVSSALVLLSAAVPAQRQARFRSTRSYITESHRSPVLTQLLTLPGRALIVSQIGCVAGPRRHVRGR
jgi:hypothetical protein